MAEEATVAAASAPPQTAVLDDGVELHTGEELTPSTAREISAAGTARVIVLAGPSDAGKTSLLVALFEKFCRGPFAGFRFARSKTCSALERRCHWLRTASGRTRADIERTKVGDVQMLLHLGIQRLDDGTTTDLLIPDIAGEEFKGATETSDDCRRLTMVRRADHFVLCLDGKKLVDLQERHAVIADGRSILRAFVEDGMLGLFSTVTVLFTKADLFENDPEVERLRVGIETDYRAAFLGKFAGMHFRASIAVPLEKAAGLEELLAQWTAESAQDARVPESNNGVPATARDIEQFSWKREVRL